MLSNHVVNCETNFLYTLYDHSVRVHDQFITVLQTLDRVLALCTFLLLFCVKIVSFRLIYITVLYQGNTFVVVRIVLCHDVDFSAVNTLGTFSSF